MVIAFKICQYSVSNKSALKLTIYFVSKLLRIRELLYGTVWMGLCSHSTAVLVKLGFYEHLPLLSLSSFWSLLLDKHGSRIVFTTSFGSTNVRRGNPIPFEKGRRRGGLGWPKVCTYRVCVACLTCALFYLPSINGMPPQRTQASCLDPSNTASKL